MAFRNARRTRKFTRRPYKTRARVGKRKRFARKQFTKSNSTYTKVAGTVIGKNALVKLNYRKDWDAGVIGNDTWATSPQTYGRTYPVAAQPASIVLLGSHFCTPIGSPSQVSTLVEDYPLALQNWASFYDKAICYGSSIKIEMMPLTATDALGRYVLIPIASQVDNTADADNANDPANTTRAILDTLDYPELCAYPGAQYGYIRTANAGVTRVKAFRKTKSMLGIKDIKDNQSSLEMILPLASNPDQGSNYTPSSVPNCWLWYLRVFSAGSNPTGNIQFMVKVKYYAQMLDRKGFEQLQSTAE